MGRVGNLVADRAPVSVKPMEDRKRAHENTDEPPSKRQALSTMATTQSSSQVPQSQEELVNFQKEAIWRQMQEYKREKNLLEARVEELDKRSKYHDDHLRITDAWWEQLLDELRVLVGKTPPYDKPYQNGDSDPAALTPLLGFEDVASFSEHLNKKRSRIVNVITDLFKELQPIAITDTKAKELQTEVRRLLAVEKAQQIELAKLKKEAEDLNNRLTDATIKYMTNAKRIDRMKSSTVQRIEKQALHQATSSGTPTDGDQNSKGDEHSSLSDSQVADLEQAKKEAQAIAEKLKEELQQLQAENTQLSKQVTDFTIKFGRLSEDDISSCEAFKNLKQKLEDVVAKYNHVEATNAQLREDVQKLQAERVKYKETIESEVQKELVDLQSQLTRAEHDVARIRTARDEYGQELATRKANDEAIYTTNKEVRELAEIREKRIDSLEEEIRRLKAHLEAPEVGSNPEISTLTHDELVAKYVQLEKAYKALHQELGGLEMGYKKAHELAQRKVLNVLEKEDKIAKLVSEKSKADQRHFQAMKAKEVLQLENRSLKVQNSKSSEIITQLKDAEKASQQLVANLEKQISEFKAAHQNFTLKSRETQGKVTEQDNTIRSLKKQIEDLSTFMKSKDAALSKEKSARQEAVLDLQRVQVRLDDTRRALNAERNQGSEDSQIEALRTLTLCSVCHSRFKQVAIKHCGHMFCKQCAEERVNLRSRKCPTCAKPFGRDDIISLHF